LIADALGELPHIIGGLIEPFIVRFRGAYAFDRRRVFGRGASVAAVRVGFTGSNRWSLIFEIGRTHGGAFSFGSAILVVLGRFYSISDTDLRFRTTDGSSFAAMRGGDLCRMSKQASVPS